MCAPETTAQVDRKRRACRLHAAVCLPKPSSLLPDMISGSAPLSHGPAPISSDHWFTAWDLQRPCVGAHWIWMLVMFAPIRSAHLIGIYKRLSCWQSADMWRDKCWPPSLSNTNLKHFEMGTSTYYSSAHMVEDTEHSRNSGFVPVEHVIPWIIDIKPN